MPVGAWAGMRVSVSLLTQCGRHHPASALVREGWQDGVLILMRCSACAAKYLMLGIARTVWLVALHWLVSGLADLLEQDDREGMVR